MHIYSHPLDIWIMVKKDSYYQGSRLRNVANLEVEKVLLCVSLFVLLLQESI